MSRTTLTPAQNIAMIRAGSDLPPSEVMQRDVDSMDVSDPAVLALRDFMLAAIAFRDAFDTFRTHPAIADQRGR